MSIKKIVSGGQTGADQAALDVAIKLDIPHGGWIPRGRMTESGPLPDKYQLRELPTDSYARRTEQNVIDSDGTLIISHGGLTGGSEYTREMARMHSRPFLHVDLDETNSFQAVLSVAQWVRDNTIHVLNIAGPRASKDPDIYGAVCRLLETLIVMELGYEKPGKIQTGGSLEQPQTVAEVVKTLISNMSLKDKATISNMTPDEADNLRFTLGLYIRNNYLYPRNEKLLESCRRVAKDKYLHWDQAPGIIIQSLWRRLCKTHKLRVVK